MMRRVRALLLVLLLCLSLIACSSEKIYRAESDELYCYGERLDGPSSIDSDKCYIVVDGNHIEYHHYSYFFTGEIDGSQVFWDNDPELLYGGTYAYTTIAERAKGGYALTITYRYPLDNGRTATVDSKTCFAE